MGEAVADVTELALLHVLLDGVEELLLGDLGRKSVYRSQGTRLVAIRGVFFECPYLLLGVGPAGDLNDHVEDGLLLVGIEGDIVEGRDGLAILLDVDTVLQGVGLADLANGVRHGGRLRRGSGCGKVSGEKSSTS